MKITNQALTSQSSDPILLNSCIITDQVGLHTVLIRLNVYVLWPIGRPLSLASPTLPQRGAFYSVRPITFREMTAAPLSKSLLLVCNSTILTAYFLYTLFLLAWMTFKDNNNNSNNNNNNCTKFEQAHPFSFFTKESDFCLVFPVFTFVSISVRNYDIVNSFSGWVWYRTWK